VEDAPYRALRYWGEDVPTLRSLAPTRVLHVSSLSKVLAPGLRLGYLVGPADVIAGLTRWAVDTYVGPVLPTQGMVHEYCRQGLLSTNIERLKEIYRPRLQATLSALADRLPQLSWSRPEGGYFVSVTLPAGNDMERLLARAQEVGLKLSDGRGFFPNPTDGDRFLRFPFSALTPETIEEAVSRLTRIL
jgi:2-aminoadipate transaminase